MVVMFLPTLNSEQTSMKAFRSVWQYRHFIRASIEGELRSRFARSTLGALWFILHPLAQAAILGTVLSEVLAPRMPGGGSGFALYLMAGMAAWGLFSEILNRCMTVFIEHAGSLKKISFPRLCLPLIVGGGALLNHLFVLLAVAALGVALGRAPSLAWLALVPAILLVAIIGFGLGILLGTLNVFARDVGQVFTVVLQLWFWLTPIVYPLEALPGWAKPLIALNPVAPVVGIYQQAIVHGAVPRWETLLVPTIVGVALAVLAFSVFRRASPEIVDAL